MTWTAGTISTVDPWTCITYGKGKFVTVANISGNTAYSTDGITWQQGTNMPWTMLWGNVWQDMTYNDDKFVAIGWAWNVAESLDGVNNWHGVNLPYQRYWGGIAYGQNTMVVTGTGYSASFTAPYGNNAVALANDPQYMPLARTSVGPGGPWVFQTTLTNPTQWAFISASGGLRVNPEFHCEIAVDGQVVVSQQGGSGVQCALRTW